MKKVLLLSMFFSLGNILFAQSKSDDAHNYFDDLMIELDGVFQIQMVNSRMTPMLTTDMLELIKAMQEDSGEVTLMYYPSIRVVIKSKEEILQGNKFTVEENIIYVNN